METVGRSSAGHMSTVNAFNVLEAQNEWSSSTLDGTVMLNSAGAGTESGWWVVDPTTGSSIGMLDTPWGVAGADMMEFLVNVVFIAISALLASVNAYACSQQAGNSVECCIGANVGLFFVGIALGFSAGLIGMALVSVEAGAAGVTAAGMTAAAIAGTAADIAALGIPIDCSAT